MTELFSFPEELSATFKLLSLTRQRLEGDMHAGLAGKGGFNKDHMAGLEKLSVAMAKLGTEIRQWSGHQKSAMDKMTPALKAKVCVQFIQDELPLGPRRDLYKILAGLEAKRTDGLKLTVIDPFGATPGPDVE